MDYASRQHRAQQLVEAIDLPRPLNSELLHHHMERLREKKILIMQAPQGMIDRGICALWLEVSGEGFERIHYAPTDSAVHRQQFVNHEFGHMILNHKKMIMPADRVALLAPLIPMNAIVSALSRSSFTDEEEALAEAIGDELATILRKDAALSRREAETGFGQIL
ncbi:hypothetical protein [Cryobacterium arcticum]|nr:hypothetical protein [Cryobacterium arcticum]